MAIVVDQASLGTPAIDSGSGGTAIVFTTSNAVASGGFIVLGVMWWDTDVPTITSVTGGSLSWSVDTQGNSGSAPTVPKVGIVSAQAPSGLASSTALTVNFSAGIDGFGFVGGTSFTGVKTSSELDGTPPAKVGVSPAATGWVSSNNTIQDGSVIIGVSVNETNGSSNTPVAPSLEGWEAAPGFGARGVLEYRIEATGGTYTVAGTWGTAAQSQTASAAYLAAATTPPVTDEAALRIGHSPITWRT